MPRRILLTLLYLVAATVIFLIWAVVARTEWEQASTPGQPGERGYHSLLLVLDGKAGAPFTYRRLVPDLATLLSRAVPPTAWEAFTSLVRRTPLAKLFDFLRWPPERYPELVSGYLIIWLGVLGFLVAYHWLLTLAYDMPAWLSHAAALLAGVMLLGGSDTRWGSYPYDIPHLFVFTLALLGVLTGAWWTLPAFAVACWSKETAVILIPAFAWLHLREWRRPLHWVMLVAMAAVWFGMRAWARWRFDVGTGAGWWNPAGNARFLARQSVYGLWLSVPSMVILVRVWLLRDGMPRHTLPLLLGMIGVLVGASFFLGWIEERRQYFELLPLAGVVGLRWVLFELGQDRLATRRRWPVDAS